MKVLVVERSKRRLGPFISLLIADAIALVWARDSEEGQEAFDFHRGDISAVVLSATTPGTEGLRQTIRQGGFKRPIVCYL